MILFPAIDLYDKKAVRLYKGDYKEMTVYSENPIEIARDFQKKGATHIHLVDLEGAKSGTTPNLEIVRQIITETNLFCEIGGGIRSLETIKTYLSIGAGRVILGTAAVQNEALLKEALLRYGDKIAVGIDIRDGKVCVRGWTETTDYDCFDFCQKMQDMGVPTIICTDISRDGAMMGTNRALYAQLCQRFQMQFIASGGVSNMDDVIHLANSGIYGAIIGKAYYTGAIDLEKAIEVAK